MMKNILGKIALVAGLWAGMAGGAYAQWDKDKASLIVDWQMNAPLATDYAEKISGWGMNFEGLYEIAPRWSVGAFINFHTNHQYVGRQTLSLSPTESLTTDQQRSAYQLPFGVVAAYDWYQNSWLSVYAGVKIGTAFARNTTYYGTSGLYDSSWGFYASPELGLKIYPFNGKRMGLHLAGFYNYMTNHTATLTTDIDGQSNVGFRLGVIF